MIAYVFWHRPRRQVAPARYEALLAAFHETLAAGPPEGFLGSTCHRAERLPWLEPAAAGRPSSDPGGAAAGGARGGKRGGYEDRYFLAGSAGLDTLDRAAVTGPREEVHAAVAELAAEGAGGLYRRRREGHPDAGRATDGLWLSKPRGRPYGAFLEELERAVPAGAQIWQRRLVLGPGPEFGLVGPTDVFGPGELPAAWSPVLVRREPVWPAPADGDGS